MVTLPKKSLERHLIADGHRWIVAVDEVGMGCLAGPVVVCALCVDPAFFNRRELSLAGLRDSKLLTAKQREAYASLLSINRFMRYAIVVVPSREVDRLNVYQASRAGMRRALKKLAVGSKAFAAGNPHILVDGPRIIAGVTLSQTAVVGGDRKVFSIAAASVLAKVYRDKMLVRYARRYPAYGLEIHKGYATRVHRAALAEHGPCPIHRRSFRLT